MCLGLTCQIRELLPGRRAVVRAQARELTVSLMTLDEPVSAGDWVLVHAGFALGLLTAQEAADALAIRGTTTEGPALTEPGRWLPERIIRARF